MTASHLLCTREGVPDVAAIAQVETANDDESIMTKGPGSVVRPLKDRLRTLCKQRRIRLQEFFKPFDVHNNKKVSKGQFQRALDQAGLMAPAMGAPASDLLTVKEVEILSKRYGVNTGGGHYRGGAQNGGVDCEAVDYYKLCEQVEKVFTRHGLEKNPTLSVKLALEDRPGSGYGVHRPGLSDGEAGLVAGLLRRARLFAETEGLIVKSLFETFDKRHSGRVTATIFLRQLDSMFKGRLSKQEARLLLRAYQTRDGDVSYRAMHADCIEDGAGRGADGGAPDAVSSSVSTGRDVDDQQQQQQRQRQGQEHQQLHQERGDEEREARINDGAPSSMSSNGVSQMSAEVDGEDFDDNASINSSVTGFPIRGNVGFMVGQETGSRSSLSTGDFIRGDGGGGNAGDGVGGKGCGGGWRRSNQGARAAAAAAAPSPKDSLPIERQMASKVAYHRLMPEDAYAPYDPTRSGTVPEAVFRRGLSDAFRMPFNEAQLATLTQRYRHSVDKISFLRLCDHVYAIADNAVVGYGRQHPQKHPQQQCGAAVEETDGQKKAIDDALEKIRAMLRRRRLSIQPGFLEFDKRGGGHVSVGQLARVLCSYGVLPADRQVQDLLAKRYAAIDDPRHPSTVFIAYRHLLEDLGEGARGSHGGCLAVGHRENGPGVSRFKVAGSDGSGNGNEDNEDGYGGVSSSVDGDGSSCCSTSVAASRVFGKPTGLSRPAHSVVSEVSMTSSVVLGRGRDRGLEELLAQLKSFTFRSRLRILEFFRCDDPMRSGTISREKFGRGLLSTGFRVSPVELETICDAYVDPDLSDKGGSPFVRYGRLVEEVEGVFGVRELERKPECDVEASVEAAQAFFTSNPAIAQPSDGCPLSPEEEAIVMETLRELGSEVYQRRLDLSPPLRDFDRFNRGVVPGTMFERALSSVGLLPVRRKARLLRRKFAERFFSPDSRSDVNYIAFLAAIQMAMAGYDKIPDEILIRANANSQHNLHTLGCGAKAGGAESKHGAATTSLADSDGAVPRHGKGAVGTSTVGTAPLQVVVQEVARQLAAEWANITDFLNDADRLKQGEISFPKLRVALALAGVLLTDEELRILQRGFRSDKSGDMVDWKRFAIAVNKIGGTPAATTWNGEIFDPSTVGASCRRSRNHHHQKPRPYSPPGPQGQKRPQGNSARFPPPSDALSSNSPSPWSLSSPCAPTPPGRSSWPAEQEMQRQQQQQQQQQLNQGPHHRRAPCAMTCASSDTTTSRAGGRHQGAIQNPHGGPGGRRGGDRNQSCPGMELEGPEGEVVANGVGSGGVGPSQRGTGEDAGDAVDAKVLDMALEAVRNRVKHYRMYLKPSFQDFDPNRKKRITREQFLSVLGNMNLNLSEREQDAICRRYTVHERSPGARVLYADFCEHVDPEHARAVPAKGAAY